MSSTRRAQEKAPLSQEKYLSSPEYTELRGLSGVAVAAKAALLDHPAKRSLLWFLQALSLEKGGLKTLAAELVAMFPERLGTPTMHRIGIKRGSNYSGSEAKKIDRELEERQGWRPMDEEPSEVPAERITIKSESDEWIEKNWIQPDPPQPCAVLDALDRCRRAALERLPGFLTDLCINPRLMFPAPGESELDPVEAQRTRDEFPELSSFDMGRAGVRYFRDIIGALYEFQRRHQEQVRSEFVLTEIGSKVWETLDFALKARRMVLIDGLEGRGKTEAARAWCRLHRGEARFVSLKGITGKTNLFIAISKALGVGCGRGYSALEMQNRIEGVLHRSGLALIIDEAHFLFDLKPRMYARPELVDWVDTALCNHEIPVGLVSTPQLLKSVQQAGAQTGWNHRQFRRRVKRYVPLPEWNTDADLTAIARKLLPGIAREGIKLAVGYAKLSKRDVSGLGDVAEEARLIAQADGREMITFEDVERAIRDYLIPSDAAFGKALASPPKSPRQAARSVIAQPVQGQCSADAEADDSDALGADEAPLSGDFTTRETQPAGLDRRGGVVRGEGGGHRQVRPALVPV